MAENLDLALRIRADLDQALREVRDLRGEFKRTGDASERTARGMSRLGQAAGNARKAVAGLAGAVAVGKVAQLGKETLESAENIQRQADALGITNERFQELVFTFRQFGLQSDEVTDSLGTIAERAQAAIRGEQSFVEQFQQIGLAAEDLRGQNPAELFRTVAEAISRVEDDSRRTGAAIELFGDDIGRKLLPLLRRGAEALDEGSAAAREFGRVQRNELIDAGAKANEELRQFAERIGSQFDRAVLRNAGSIEELAEKFGGLVTSVVAAADQLNRFLGFLDEVKDQALGGDTALEQLKQEQNEVREGLEDIEFLQNQPRALRGGRLFSRADVGPLASDEELAQRERELRAELERIARQAEDIRDLNRREREREQRERDRQPTIGGDDTGTGDTGGGSEPTVNLPAEPGRPLGPATDVTGIRSAGQLLEQSQQQIELLERGQKLVEQTRTAEERFDAARREALELYQEGAIGAETFRRAVGQANEELRRTQDEADKTGNELSQFAIRARRSIQEQVGNTLNKTIRGSFDGILKAWENTLLNMVAQANATRLNEALFGKDGKGGGLVDQAVGAITTFFGGAQGSEMHTGGMVGRDGRLRVMTPPMLASAERFQAGGFPGLRSDEVPAILHRGEEVLARGDPRNARNAGGMKVEVNQTIQAPNGGKDVRRASGKVQREVVAAVERAQRRHK